MNSEPVFDFHARLAPRPNARDELLTTMDATGIARAGISAGGVVGLDRLASQIIHGGHSVADAANDAVLDACRGAAGRLVPFFFANPHADISQYRHRVHRFRALEVSPAVHGVPFDDPRMLALVAIAAGAGHPVYTVCLNRAGSRTGDLVTLAGRFPEATFVSGHAGFIGVDTDGIRRVASRPNISVETSGCFSAVARLALDLLGPGRVLFGTEAPLQHPAVEFAKFAALGLDPAAWRQVSWSNAHRVLGEEPR